MASSRQHLYDAIMTLGRSAQDAANGGWTCGELGWSSGPKCVNGLITWHLGAKHACYITEDMKLSKNQQQAALIAARALAETAPSEVVPYLGRKWSGTDLRSWPLLPVDDLEDLLVAINDAETDEPVLNSEMAAAWFSRAMDLLAQQLPDPLPTLTVDEIVAAPSLVDTVEEPDRPLVTVVP